MESLEAHSPGHSQEVADQPCDGKGTDPFAKAEDSQHQELGKAHAKLVAEDDEEAVRETQPHNDRPCSPVATQSVPLDSGPAASPISDKLLSRPKSSGKDTVANGFMFAKAPKPHPDFLGTRKGRTSKVTSEVGKVTQEETSNATDGSTGTYYVRSRLVHAFY